MNVFGTFITVAVLWFLITLFTRAKNSSQSLTETWIVVIGMMIVGLLTRWLLGDLLGIFTVVVNVVALYVLVDKVCGTSRAVTVRICAWYFGITSVLNLFFYLLSS